MSFDTRPPRSRPASCTSTSPARSPALRVGAFACRARDGRSRCDRGQVCARARRAARPPGLADHARGKRKQAPKPRAPRARDALAAAQTSAAALEQAVADAQAELASAINDHSELAARLDEERDGLQPNCARRSASCASVRATGWRSARFATGSAIRGPSRR